MKTLAAAMRDSIFKILETMFFLSLELNPHTTIENSRLLDADTILVSRLDFKGPFAGFFRLYVPENLLKEMTGNFMGLERPEISTADLEGTILELIKMIAGKSFSTLNNRLEFQFEMPVIEEINRLPEPGQNVRHKEICLVPETINGFLALKAVYSTCG